MKNVIVTVVMLVGLLTFAQENQEKREDRRVKMENRERLTPEQQAELQVKKMTLDLDLTSKQQTEVKKLVLEQAKKREAKKAEMKAKRADGEKLSNDEKFALKNKMLDEQIAMKAEMKKILTPEQVAKWEAKQAERKDKMQERRESKGKKQKGRK